jgi:hypothetical protein
MSHKAKSGDGHKSSRDSKAFKVRRILILHLLWKKLLIGERNLTSYLFVYLSDEAAANENVTIAFRTLKALVTQKIFMHNIAMKRY